MKYCLKCSASIEDNFKFCTKCGNPIIDFTASEASKKTSPKEPPIAEESSSEIKTPDKSNKGKLIVAFCLIALVGFSLYYFTKTGSDSVDVSNGKETELSGKETNDENSQVFLKQFVNKLNTNPFEINNYVDNKSGVVNFFYDATEGFVAYSEPKFIIDEVDNNPLIVNGENVQFYEEVKNHTFPEYLGAFEYQDYGSYFKEFDIKKDKINPNNYGTKESIDVISSINNSCNYICKAMTTRGDYVFTFYFLIKEKKKQLLAYNIEPVIDIQFVSLKKDKKIPFSSETIVLNYLKNKYFYHTDDEGKYFIDFKTNNHNLNWEREIVNFNNLKLGELVNISKNIQYRELLFDSENQIVNGKFYITNYGEIRIITRSLDEPIVLNSK